AYTACKTLLPLTCLHVLLGPKKTKVDYVCCCFCSKEVSIQKVELVTGT
ncbi:hypothetical protein GBAR_LOCUS13396, partial [Geodia barretti]